MAALGVEKKNIGRVEAGEGKMGTGSEVEAGGFDGMSRLGECGWVLLMLLTEVPHGAHSRAEVQGYRDTYNRGVWPGVADEVRTLKYLCTWYLGRAGAVRFGGGSNNAGTRARHTLALQRPHSQASSTTNTKYCICYDDTMALTIYAMET